MDRAVFCEGCRVLIEPAAESLRPPAPVAAAYVYAGPLADAIRGFKYGQRPGAGRALGELLAAEAACYAGHIDRVIPVPLHAARLRERGFNQSALLARAVARGLGVALDTRSLRRVRPTRDQAGLARNQRATNVRAAFIAVSRPRQSGRVLLVDDVRTTGSTLSAAVRALLDAGYAEVRSLALAQADDGDATCTAGAR
jgi:ComF family protein